MPGSPRIDAEIPSKLETLVAATLELAARRAANRIDLTGVRALRGAEVDAGAAPVRGERRHPEVSGLDRRGDVVPASSAPPNEILRGDQDAAVVSGAATCATRQAVERVVRSTHGVRWVARLSGVAAPTHRESAHSARDAGRLRSYARGVRLGAYVGGILFFIVGTVGCSVDRGGLRDLGQGDAGADSIDAAASDAATDARSDVPPGPCVPTSPPTDVCDGVDNDCDPETPDGAQDPELGHSCDGDDADGCIDDEVECVEGVLTCVDRGGDKRELCEMPGDEDCDGDVDEGDAADATAWFADGDEDGYGDPSGSVSSCTPLPGRVSNGDDCDDDRGDVHPGAYEVCDFIDQDCDGRLDDAECHVGCESVRLGGREYFFCEAAPWTTARARCESLAGHLAKIETMGENNRILMESQSRFEGNWWIGLNDRDVEGTFRWHDGTTAVFLPWNEDEPNDGGGLFGAEDCVELLPPGTWNDQGCEDPRPFVCEQR